jgi:hypothetical protein
MVCSVSILIYGCGAAPLGTQVSVAVNRNAADLVLALDREKESECARRNIVKKKFIAARKDTHSRNEEIETWTVDRCGVLVNYRVTVTTVESGGKQLMVEAEKS